MNLIFKFEENLKKVAKFREEDPGKCKNYMIKNYNLKKKINPFF